MTWLAVTSGRVTGILGLVAGLVVVVIGIADGAPAGIVAGLILALLAWIVLLRPRLGTRDSDLLIRGMVSTVVIPLASIESMVVRQVLSVAVDGRHYVSAAVGHSLREINRQRRSVTRAEAAIAADEAPGTQEKYADHVLDLLTERSHAARRDGAPTGPARREWAWPEIAGLGVLLVALVVTLVL